MASSSSRGAFGGGRDVEYDPKNPHAGRPSSAASARALMQQKSAQPDWERRCVVLIMRRNHDDEIGVPPRGGSMRT